MLNIDNATHSYFQGREVIGGNAQRIDINGKVSGQTRYVEDIVMAGLLHASVLRSPHHHARLLSLDINKAVVMPGVVRVITARDIPGLNGLDGYSRNEPVLTPLGDTLRHKGAPIALVVAESPRLARQASQAIAVEYEILPHQFDADDALEENAPDIYPAGNVLNTYSLSHGDLGAAFGASDVILETDYQTAFQEHSALERESVLGYIDADGHLTVVSGTHEPHWQRDYIGQTLGIDPLRVRVIVPPTGGSFGSRQDPWPLVATGLMAYLLEKPVRLVYTRAEVFDATPKRHPYHVKLKIGASSEGRLTGIQVRITANTGGYDSAGYWIPNYAVTSSGGPYTWQAVDAFAQSVYTNGPKCGQFRGYGTPQSTFATECTLDELAQQLQIDPLELRLKNRLLQGGISFLGYPVGESLGFAQVLEALRPSYRRYQEEAQEANILSTPYRLGVGLAGMWYRFGKSGSLRVETQAELAGDGHFIIYCSAPDYGQGIGTVMLQLAAEALGVPRDSLELVNADTNLTPDSGIQGASRATYFTGSSVVNAAENLKLQIIATAAEMIDCDPSELSIQRMQVVDKSNPTHSVTLTSVAEEMDRLGKSRRATGIFDLSPQFPQETRPEYIPVLTTGAQVALVQVDMETGQVRVKRIAAAHDVGRTINPSDAIGQIQGAIVMGIGTALLEEYRPGLTTGFTDYILPMIDAVPEMEVCLVEVPSYYGPHGAKGLGEAAILPTAPAIINAISRAIGVRLRRLPATPERVFAAIRSRGFHDAR